MTKKEKEVQLQYKERHTETLKKLWKNDSKMVDYCLKNCSAYVPLENNNYIIMEKPKIKTSFCFGYSLNSHDTEDYDNANEMVHYAENNENYFKKENLKDFDFRINRLKDKSNKYVIGLKYYDEEKTDTLKEYSSFSPYQNYSEDFKELSDNDRNTIIKALEVEKAKFEKRLNTYLKRYGLSKINSWSYWQDE